MDDLETIIRRNEQMTAEQERQVIRCLAEAGLCGHFANRIIQSGGNKLARDIVQLIHNADPMLSRIRLQPPV